MQDTMRIGAAALGGYVLGRTKKAKTAITLALWLAGKGRPSDMARTQAVKALQSDKGQEMLAQLRGPVMEAGKTAALSMFEAQAGRLSDSMSRRTDSLTASPSNGKRKSSRRSKSEDDEQGEDELSERRRPSGRKPDRDRRPPEDRDIEDDEYEDDEDEYADEYDDEADEDDDRDEEADEDEDAEEYEDEYDDYEDEDDDRATTRRRAS